MDYVEDLKKRLDDGIKRGELDEHTAHIIGQRAMKAIKDGRHVKDMRKIEKIKARHGLKQ